MVKMMIHRQKWLAWLLLLAMLFTLAIPVAAEDTAEVVDETGETVEEPFSIKAKAAMLVDLNTGRSIYEQNADERVYPASLTKIMTCLVALENGNLSDIVTVSESALSTLDADSSVAGLKVGEQMTLENMLYCMMIVSGNDACNVIAEHIAGSVEDYVRMMNERAYELGCENTHFVNVHGLHDEDHYTTVRDLSIITQAALKSANFRQITGLPEYELPATNLSDARTLTTTNMLIYRHSANNYFYPRASGIKTGYTSAAGRCVISTAKDDGVELLGIVCGANTSIDQYGGLVMESFPECIKLFDYGFDGFSYVSAISPLYPLAQVTVKNSAGSEAVALAPKNAILALLPNDYDESKMVIDIDVPDDEVEAPVKKGDVLGSVNVNYDGEDLGTTDLLAIADVAKSELTAVASETTTYIQSNWWKWLVVIILLLLAALCVLVLVMKARRRRQRRQILEQRRKAAERRWDDED